MAATYQLVVTTVNCYSSVVIDCHFQHTVHYCTGTCQVFKQGVACIVAHHSICAELLRVPASNVRGADLDQRLPTPENGLTLAGNEDYQQILPSNPRLKKGSSVQATCSLKDITGEAINLASGKIKEFSFERLKNSSSHVTYRKGRKVRSESFSRRSLDFDLIYGHFNNDENCPPFGLLQTPSAGEKWQESCNSSEGNVNTAASLSTQAFSEESFISQILEKHKLDSSSGGDIKVCLDILLKCSEDLKKCTDIIKHCIKKKSSGDISGGNDNDALASSEMIYRNLMTRFSSYLKKLPIELKQPSHVELGDLAELVTSLHGLQQAPFSPIFGNEQPPRYEDIVHLPSAITRPSLTVELQDGQHEIGTTSPPKPIQTNTGGFTSDSLHSSTQQNNSRTVKNASTVPQLLTVSPSNCVSSIEMLYIEEESDGEIVLGKGKRAEHKGSWESLESSQQKTGSPDLTVVLKEAPARVHAEAVAQTSEKITFIKPVSDSLVSDSRASTSSGEQRESRENNQDEIDKLLLDLEHFSQKMESALKEPTMKENDPGCLKDFGQEGAKVLPLALETKNKVCLFPDKNSTSPLSKTVETNGHKMEEDDKALLLRILGSIEDFAQELVECHMGKGSLSKEKEMMQILQETLTTPSQSFPAVQRSMGATTKDTVPTLIQQAPEVIKVQNKQEKKPGTPSPAPLKSAISPRPLVTVNKVIINAPVSINIPRFYFPKGLPSVCNNHEETIARIEASFTEFEDEKANIYEMGKIAKVCGCPLYWKAPMFNAAGGERTGFVSVHSFVAMWRQLLQSCHDDAAKFLYLLAKPNCNYLEQEDFIPLLQDVVETHPGLTFLKDAPEFHSRYITTVIQRIFYMVNRSWSGKITLMEMRKSNFLQTLALLEEEDDINQITDYFSYEHFYVIYCKFWELDTDHDLYISQKDLARYNDQALSTRIIERIFSGAVVRGNEAQKEGRLSYADFVWLLIAEEDKRSPTSIEYWFRCLDSDGDGVLSMYELEYFYEEQCERMEAMGIEPLPFHDLLCQMLDLVKPDGDGRVTLRDLKRCRMAHVFYNTFFNLEKYLDNEQRDPFAIQKDVENDGPEPSDWDRYAAEEYELLVAEESGNEQLQEGSFEEDYETDELLTPPETGDKLDKLVISDLSS
ncbi:serine/threonine-protein phosphatase 2A regulatory subunit B'' subunit alpha isoform X1 [Chelonia mydas]|uniref:serine/threonine-protein phosphatase 2A regulatory subunit B'' subunit alpha isoform X1 n=1 Tax=Chelonia mydas TaxID=8469 RepID=UPI000FFBA0FA|nr:serine/threonine-protein phosphatase 2A regulatory subunit B'' subunit alpha isoform X1 [Chelonia mydas]XP_037764500.1 serine/threonine-protein phosphatase 2A regulatory subunit B'' subunit alpha isoform X1 [Chelonia mydas]XP_043377932.1 serine/threonine-protein phosphatase 2A regulatory subunit B'' subunit alpha isoform X1 [Chelonia mydas]XP_043377933.1 serine/threonine-protein phosphatase 2A regulatory subunit B'' subunit alpha isoform X1 [Chelonia mydas]